MTRLLSPRLLRWYACHQRDLPWRRTRDPYRIWVAEVMLQQTRVETVIPYYQRFTARFPDVATLAAASLEDVLKLWENLGYYARARHLHGAAKEILARHGGRIPSSWDELMAIRGIGEYSAGAILSIAFDQRVPAVDGNVRRVLSRVFAIRESLDRGPVQKALRDLASALVPVLDPGGFNQALMDLGSDVCRPKDPSCPDCPWKDECESRRLGLEREIPVQKPRAPLPQYHATAGVIRDGRGRVLLIRRTGRGLLAGLWGFPGGRQEEGEGLEACLRRSVCADLGLDVTVRESMATVRHAYTHFRIILHVFAATPNGGPPQALGCAEWRWVSKDEISRLPLAKADRLVANAAFPNRTCG